MQEWSSCSMPYCSSVQTLSNLLSLHAIRKTPCVLAFVLHRCGKENQTIGSQGSIHVKECGWKCYQHLGNWFAEVVQKFQKSFQLILTAYTTCATLKPHLHSELLARRCRVAAGGRPPSNTLVCHWGSTIRSVFTIITRSGIR